MINSLYFTYYLIKKAGLLNLRLFRKYIFVPLYYFYKKYYEDPFYGLTKSYPTLFNKGHILDIGANIGFNSLVFSKVIRNGLKIYSFEPDPANYTFLNEVIKDYKVSDVIIPICSAVGKNDGTAELMLDEMHYGNHKILTKEYKQKEKVKGKTTVVPIISVDNFAKSQDISSNIGFIKIDVQGYEFPVCQGMEETLRLNPQAGIALEYSPKDMTTLGYDHEKLIQFFKEKDYFAYLLPKNGIPTLASSEDIAFNLKKRDYINLLFSRSKF